MKGQRTYQVTLDSRIAGWAAASAKIQTVEQFLGLVIAGAILGALDGGDVDVQVDEVSVTLNEAPGWVGDSARSLDD